MHTSQRLQALHFKRKAQLFEPCVLLIQLLLRLKSHYRSTVLLWEPVVLLQEPVVLLHEPVVLLQEPVVLLQEPVVLLHEPVMLLQELMVLLQEPVVLLKEPVVLLLWIHTQDWYTEPYTSLQWSVQKSYIGST